MLFGGSDRVEMKDEEFRMLSSFIYDHCGLHFDESNRFILESRLQNRLRQHHLESFLQYFHYLVFHEDRTSEMNALLEVITTNETYFYREKYQLEALAEEVLPDLAARNASRRKLRIWSAGCSTGEETYTLAILVRESGLFDDSWRVDILGTDISRRVLRTARKAVYAPSSFRAVEDPFIQRYFTGTSDGKLSLDESIRTMVHFAHLNLMDERMMGFIGPCDIIMCRNVIIYFDSRAKARVMQSFFRKLAPEGYLLLGHSESLMNVTTVFRLKHLARVMVYQKPGESG